MKPKHYLAFLIVLASLCWFAMMTAPLLNFLTSVQSRLTFLLAFVIAISAGIIALCYLFTEMKKGE